MKYTQKNNTVEFIISVVNVCFIEKLFYKCNKIANMRLTFTYKCNQNISTYK